MMYTVGEMAKILGVPASTLRYYDKEGMLPFVERTSGGIRMFKEQDYEWLKIIECMKKAGMPIKDIKNYIELALEGDVTIHERLELIHNHHFKWWFVLALIRAILLLAPKGGIASFVTDPL